MNKLFIVILLAVVGVVGAGAQEATVKSFEMSPMDVTARTHSRLDLHGEKCAVVKVRVIADGVAFQGNLIGEPVEKPGEYWVYLTDGTKQFQILSRSFLPFMYNFDEPLKGGVTYVLTLLAPQPAAGAATPQRKKQNFLVLKVTPSTAHVTVDGAELPLENGIASKLLPAGTHVYRVTAPGYAPHEETVTIGEDKVSRNVTLRSVKPRLTVTTTTPGTEIFINEISRGTDRWNGELYADTYVVEGRLAGHRHNSQTVTLAEDQSRTVTIPALTPITGTLSVDYKPYDATVTIDDRAAGTTPLHLDDILVGTHRVTISATGYNPATLTATISETAPATLTGALTPKPTDHYADDIAHTKEYEYFKDYSTGKYGYKHNGRVVIPAKYDDAYWFSEGLASVKINGKWGFIDKTDTMVIPAKYDGALYFREGLASVKINGKWGFIDKTDTMVIPAKFDDAWSFSEGLAWVVIDGKYGFIDKSGTIVIPAKFDDAWSFSNGKAQVKLNDRWFYIDRNGNEVQ
ncbi:MAG: WG repeat-containing protein [Muribaculaceae bacterium]|nr:WG repeat-containing protein [Muribaculaceae bacterium]